MNGQAVNPFLFDPSSMEGNSSAEENSTMSSASSGEDSPLGGDRDSGLLMNAVMMMNSGGGGAATSPGMGTTPRSAGSLSKVQSQSSPLAAKSPVMSPSAPKGGGGNGGGDGTEHRQKTDLFLSQFQAQMSQMKEAMDELLNKSSGSPSSPSASARASSPSGSGGGGGRKRKGGGGGGSGGSSSPAVAAVPVPTITTTYQSQISTGNGLKLKIRKSSHQKRMYKKRGPKAAGGGAGGGGGGRKSRKKRRKGHDDDEDPISDYFDEDDYYEDIPGPSKCLPHGGDDTGDSSRLPTGWGDQLPETVLEKIFSHGVQNSMGGCIPFLVRVSKVSKLWRKVASKPEMWTEVDLASPRVKHVYRTERNLIYFLEHRFPHAKHLNLGGWSSALTSQAIEVLVRYCKELESLVVSSCQKLSGPNLKRITEECRCLKKLDLSSVSVRKLLFFKLFDFD